MRKTARASTSHHAAAVAIPSSNTAGHTGTFLPTADRLWNELPEAIVAINERERFKKEINTFLCGRGRGTAAKQRKKPT